MRLFEFIAETAPRRCGLKNKFSVCKNCSITDLKYIKADEEKRRIEESGKNWKKGKGERKKLLQQRRDKRL